MDTQSITLASDEQTLSTLKSYFKAHFPDVEMTYTIAESSPSINLTYQSHNKIFPKPARIGAIIDEIRNALASQKEKIISFLGGEATLDCTQGLFSKGNQEPITLTEKEVELLNYLSDVESGVAGKEELLEHIWGYAEGIETHTLETHIYRLRQKIETDPSKPKILITKNDGYCITP